MLLKFIYPKLNYIRGRASVFDSWCSFLIARKYNEMLGPYL